MTTTSGCPVCALITSGSAPARTELWRTSEVIAYLYRPDAESVEQVAVAPLRHAATILEVTDEEWRAVMREARSATAAFLRAVDPDGYTLHQHSGEIEAQPAPHFELLIAAKAFGTAFGERPADWMQEPFVPTDELTARWRETYETRVALVARMREALARAESSSIQE